MMEVKHSRWKTEDARDKKRSRLGKRLNEELIIRGMTHSDLAEALGISRQSVSSVVNHHYNPTKMFIIAVCCVLELDFDEIWAIAILDKEQPEEK